jgi:integrase
MATRSRVARSPDARATGQVLTYERKDGLTSWYLRVRAYGGRHRIKLGTELDGWTEARAKIELQNVLAKIQAGLWEPPVAQSADRKDPTFHEFATSWLTRRKPSFKERTYEHYEYMLTHHLLPRFARLRLSQIDYSLIDRYVETKQLESEEVREAARRGVPLLEASGARKRPLSNSTINATVELLSAILDEAVRRKLLPANPAREKGLRLKEQRARGNVLEIDELEDLLAAAEELDQKVTPKVLERGAAARELRQQGMEWKEIVAWGWHKPPRSTTRNRRRSTASARGGPSSPASWGRGCGTRSCVGSTSAIWTLRTGTSMSKTRRPRLACGRSISARCCWTTS